VNRSRNEATEEGSRCSPVETMVVVQHAFQHGVKENLSDCLKWTKKATGARK
jgi:hypothetical protein